MNRGTARGAFLSVVVALLLAGSGAASASTTTLALTFTTFGSVTNAGNQSYVVQGNQLAFGKIDGYTLDPGTTTIRYSLDALVDGLETSGGASVQIEGTVGSTTVSLNASLAIESQATETANLGGLGVGVPLGCGGASNATTPPCASFIPGFFVASGNVTVTTSAGQGAPSQTLSAPGSTQTEMFLESPYLNPWGGPVVIASAGCFDQPPTSCPIAAATTYQTGIVNWVGFKAVGDIDGLLGVVAGSIPVSGTLTVTANEHENLVTGTTVDSGTMILGGFTSSLTANPLTFTGQFQGDSLIPSPSAPPYSAAGEACSFETSLFKAPCASDCSASLGFPGTGVCTVTGFQSAGQFVLECRTTPLYPPAPGQSPQADFTIAGRYSTTWSVPAFWFYLTAPSATLSQH